MGNDLSALITILQFVKDFGIEFLYYEDPKFKHPAFSYIPYARKIQINKTAMEMAPFCPDNIKFFAHSLLHELAHAIQECHGSKFERKLNLKEEKWADRFATEVCKKFGISGVKKFEAYVNGRYLNRGRR